MLNRLRSLLPWQGGTSTGTKTLPVNRREAHRALDETFDRFFDRFLEDGWATFPDLWRDFPALGEWRQPVDWSEDDDAWTLKLEVPGFDPAELDLSIAPDEIRVKGEHQEESDRKGNGGWARTSGQVSVRLPVPRGVRTEEAEANLKNGVLTVRLPKSEETRKRTRRIPIAA